MYSASGQCALYLCPENHQMVFDTDALVSLLYEIGFISKKIDIHTAEHHYFTGDHYLNHISYMGCAPTVQFEATEEQPDFCSVSIHQYDFAKLIYSNTQSRPPHCPCCRKPVKDWLPQIASTKILCSSCETASDIENFNWRKMAGYARLFIKISDIFPKEAIPQQSLMDYLTENTGTGWQYFYSCR